MSAPDSICWSKLAAMSGSIFLRSSSDKLVTDLGFYRVSQKLPKKKSTSEEPAVAVLGRQSTREARHYTAQTLLEVFSPLSAAFQGSLCGDLALRGGRLAGGEGPSRIPSSR